jgi:hypothetical protein
MHETSNNLVKGFIDIFEKDSNIYKLKGWAFHNNKIINPIRLKIIYNKKEIIFLNLENNQIREDVYNFYNEDALLNCGWEFMIDNNDKIIINLELELEMYFNNVWNTIFIFQKNKKFIPSFLIVDNYYDNPDLIRNFALKQDFQSHPNYHKGKRTDQIYRFDGLKESFEELLGHKIRNWDEYAVSGCFQYCIGGDQLVYHVDLQQYAAIIFLTPNPPPESGTTFYRSKTTKKMNVNSDEYNIVFKNGFLDSTEFEIVDVVGNIYNRLLLFDSQMIHAASTYFGDKLENSRLFQIFFFDLE